MKAAVVTSFTSRSRSRARDPGPRSRAGPGAPRGVGLCHTDIHAAHGDWPVKPMPPFVPGHEGVGIVEELGDGVTAPGSATASPFLARSACGHCRYCVDGRETLCESQQNSGYSIDGAFAEYAVVDAAYAVTVPDGVEPSTPRR